jgi:hypothetical protein
MKSNNNNNDDDDDDDDDDDNNNNNNNTAMGSVHARGDTFLTFGLKALTERNTSRLATAPVTFSFISAPQQCLVKITNYEAPPHVNFVIILSENCCHLSI